MLIIQDTYVKLYFQKYFLKIVNIAAVINKLVFWTCFYGMIPIILNLIVKESDGFIGRLESLIYKKLNFAKQFDIKSTSEIVMIIAVL